MMEDILYISMDDIRRIVTTVRTVSGVDLNCYEPIVLCHRIEVFMQRQGFIAAEALVQKLMQDKVFCDFFLSRIRIQTTELFRDPQMWKELEANVFSKLKYESVIKIWVPDVCGDDELNTLLIMLDKNNLLSKSMVYATSPYPKTLAEAQLGQVDAKKLEISIENYQRAFAGSTIDYYFEKVDKFQMFSRKLLNHAIFIKQSVINDNPPDQGFNLVLFRNRSLLYNSFSRKATIEKLYKSILPGGYFVIGIGENLKGLEQAVSFTPVSKTENIFKKN